MAAALAALLVALAGPGPALPPSPLSPPATPAPPAPRPAFPDPSRAVARALRTVPAGGARAAAATRALLGAPYAASPLGEGSGPDSDPRFRLDAFDCMTFVETAVALGSACTLGEARRALDDIRYAGAPALAARNHEVLSQWIPQALAKGWARDVTRAIAGARARRVEETYTPARWEAVRRAGRAIAGLPRARLPAGTFEAWVVPPEDAAAIAGAIPEGTIAFVIRGHEEERATRVTHAGLVVVTRDGARRVRHATSTRGVARVIEEPLERFLAREAKAHPRWRIEGVALLAIADGRARIEALAGGEGALPPARPAVARPPAPAPASPATPRL